MATRADFIARLERLDACALSDALDSLGLSGAHSGIERRATRQRIAGSVQTVLLHDRQPAEGPARHLGTAAIEAADALTVIVVEQRTGIDCAGWGGVLANAAKTKGVRGVLLAGPVRDIDECDSIGFPVFARGTTARTARGRVWEQSWGEPIRVGDSTVRAGDYVLADGRGVVYVAEAQIESVLALAERIASKESLMTHDVLAGKPVSAVMGTDYETMLQASGDSSDA